MNYDNFAVDESGKVTVIDLEHIVVADKQAIQAGRCLASTIFMYRCFLSSLSLGYEIFGEIFLMD